MGTLLEAAVRMFVKQEMDMRLRISLVGSATTRAHVIQLTLTSIDVLHHTQEVQHTGYKTLLPMERISICAILFVSCLNGDRPGYLATCPKWSVHQPMFLPLIGQYP